jgi:hypothetical protein
VSCYLRCCCCCCCCCCRRDHGEREAAEAEAAEREKLRNMSEEERLAYLKAHPKVMSATRGCVLCVGGELGVEFGAVGTVL